MVNWHKLRTRGTPTHATSYCYAFSCSMAETMFNSSSCLEEVDKEEVGKVLQINTRSTTKPGPRVHFTGLQGLRPKVVITSKPPVMQPPKERKLPATTRFEPAAKQLPQYRLTSNAEDSDLLQKVIGQSMNAEITIT